MNLNIRKTFEVVQQIGLCGLVPTTGNITCSFVLDQHEHFLGFSLEKLKKIIIAKQTPVSNIDLSLPCCGPGKHVIPMKIE